MDWIHIHCFFMKRINTLRTLCAAIAITGALFSTASHTSAQLRYGFRLGGEFASAKLSDAGSYFMRNRSGFSGGLALEYQMPQYGFAPDIAVVYTRYNTQLESASTGMSSSGRDFIGVPLHLKYKFWLKSTKELFAPLVYTGPSVMFRIGHNESQPLTTKSVQAGWDVGIGFDIVNFIQITGGYRFGLGNAIDSFSGYPDASIRANGWNVSANILFDF